MNTRKRLHIGWIGMLALALVLTSFPWPGKASANGISSDLAGHWAEKNLQVWLEQGRISGYPDGTIRPDKPITRAEWMKLTNALFGYTERSAAAFSDVRESDWYASDAAIAVQAGYMQGYEDGTIRPNTPLSRRSSWSGWASWMTMPRRPTDSRMR